MTIWQRWQLWIKQLKRETRALYFAYLDPRTPWYARFLILIIVGYALSPIDLIPDFIPVLGHLDDAILLPLAIMLVLRLIPSDVMRDSRQRAENQLHNINNINRIAVVLIICIRLVIVIWLLSMLQNLFKSS